jgi:hypothetical protein
MKNFGFGNFQKSLNRLRNLLVALAAGLFVISGAASASAEVKFTGAFPGGLQNAGANALVSAVKASGAQSEAALLVGVWRYNTTSYGARCQAEMVFQGNGGYSGLTSCPGASWMFHTVGRWGLLQRGAIRLQYSDYAPKHYLGNPIRIPDGETFYYRFLDRNRIALGDGSVIAYRVG